MTSQNTLSFKGAEFNVRNFNYHLFRKCDDTGIPEGDVLGGLLTVTVLTKKKNTNMLSSILTKESCLNGKILVKEGQGDKTSREIEFSEGYVINYKESYDTADHGLTTTFTVSDNKLTIDGLDYNCEWPTE